MNNWPWTADELAYLREHYGKLRCVDIAVTLGRSPDACMKKARSIGLSRPMSGRRWTVAELGFLAENYRRLGSIKVAEALGRNRVSVMNKAKRAGITKMLWSPGDKRWLLENFPILGAEQCAKVLHRSPNAIRIAAHKAGLYVFRIGKDARPNARTKALVGLIAAETGCDPQAILGHQRERKLVKARWRLMKELRANGYSLSQIGHQLGRDHTSVLHALRRLEEIAA